jgi:hypothetical protein
VDREWRTSGGKIDCPVAAVKLRLIPLAPPPVYFLT